MNVTPTTNHYILDGGSLLHRVPWKNGDMVQSPVLMQTLLLDIMGQPQGVFDGYSGGASIKDNTPKAGPK